MHDRLPTLASLETPLVRHLTGKGVEIVMVIERKDAGSWS